jgi:hypothetical protein
MGAVAKNLIPQLVQATAQPSLGLCNPDSAAPPQATGLEESRRPLKFPRVVALEMRRSLKLDPNGTRASRID